uniref:Kazal-like domain-containing protein n=1 Tax=Trichobilharzia regenti TaxID=157069 RepID=A0AA85KB36_TRIRE|nr:unnamed protein product [Trichobilharzia regenti]
MLFICLIIILVLQACVHLDAGGIEGLYKGGLLWDCLIECIEKHSPSPICLIGFKPINDDCENREYVDCEFKCYEEDIEALAARKARLEGKNTTD